MKSVLYKEFKTMKQQKQIIISYFIVLLLWGILQPISALVSLAGTSNIQNITNHFFYSTNFITFSAFFLMISVAQSNQTFLGEKSSQTLNTILATPVKIQSLIIGKWLSAVLFVSVMAVSIFTAQWVTYFFAVKGTKMFAPFIFPSFSEVCTAFLPLILLWGIACWYGAFLWLKFDNYQSANITSILLVLPLLVAEYFAVEYSLPVLLTGSVLVLVNVLLGLLAVAINHRDRLAQLS